MNQFDSASLSKMLSDFLSDPIKKSLLSDPYVNPTYTNTHLRADNVVELEQEARLADDFFQKICALQPANPSKGAKIAKLNASFEDAYNSNVNRLKGFSAVQAELERVLQENDRVAFVGRRGSGKTTILNKWLNERTKTFFETADGINHVWFRIDASKIYNSSRGSGVDEYFTAHTAFVFLLYSGFVDVDEEKPSAFFQSLISKIPEKNLDVTVRPFAASLQELIRQTRSQTALSDKSVPVVGKIISSPVFLKQAQDICELLILALEESKVGLICIVDGIDNVSYSKSNSKYQTMCQQMREFFGKYFSNHPNLKKKLLIASRPETIPELELRAVGTNHKVAGDFIEVTYRIVNVPVVSPTSVLRRKIDAIKRPEFDEERRAFLSGIQRLHPNDSEKEIMDARIKKYGATNFETLVVDELNKIVSAFPFSNRTFYIPNLSIENFLSDFFDGDVRAYLASFRRIAHGRRYYAALNIQNIDSVDLIPEIFVLSGRVYKTTAHNMSEGRERYIRPHNADLFPNIFWYEAAGRAEAHHKWHGLCGLRLLQIANFRKKRIYEIAKILNVLFDYPYDMIQETIQTFIAYGLIDVEYDSEIYDQWAGSAADLFRKENPLHGHNAIISTTKKGRICATLSLIYFKWLYFLALDTPLLRFFLPEESGDNFIRFYKSYRNLTQTDFNFWDAVIPTSSVLLKHISHFHAREMTKVRDVLMHGETRRLLGDYGDFNTLAELFSLPEGLIGSHVTRFMRLLKSRHDQVNRDRPGYEGLIRAIEAMEATKPSYTSR